MGKQAVSGRLFVALLAWLLVAFSDAADAQPDEAIAEAAAVSQTAEEEPAEPPLPPLVRSAERLMARLAVLREEHRDLEQQLKDAGAGDRLVLDRKTIDVKLEFLDLIGKIVDNVLKQEAEGLDTAELRDEAGRELRAVTPAIVRHVEAVEELIAGIQRERDEAAVADRLAIEQRLEREVAWLDRLYRGYLENIQHRESLELPAGEPREDLARRLSERTRLQAARLEVTIEQLGELAARMAEQPDNADLVDENAALAARRAMLTDSVSRLVKHMDALGLDASEQQQLLITSTGEVTSDILKPAVALGLVEAWVDEVRAWVRDNGMGVVFKILLFLAIMAIARIASGLTRRLLRHALGSARVQTSRLLQSMLIAVVGNLILVLGFLIALSQLGFELGPLLAGLGIAGFIIGFALQDALSNFAAGMMILGYRPFDVGDVIEVAGVRGTVETMSLVNTTILTFDKRTRIIPNNKIWGDVVTNFTNQKQRRVDLEVRIPYDQDLDRCERILREVVAQDSRVLEDPPPAVRMHQFGEYAMVIMVRPWVRTDDYWELYWDMTGAIKRRLDTEGIPVAVPRREVRMTPEPGAGA